MVANAVLAINCRGIRLGKAVEQNVIQLARWQFNVRAVVRAQGYPLSAGEMPFVTKNISVKPLERRGAKIIVIKIHIYIHTHTHVCSRCEYTQHDGVLSSACPQTRTHTHTLQAVIMIRITPAQVFSIKPLNLSCPDPSGQRCGEPFLKW